jgi:hypothetical protein
MALSATIALTESVVNINQPVHGVVTISNSGASNLLLISFVPRARLTGSTGELNIGMAVSAPAIGAGQNVTIPAGGTLAISCQYIFFSPSTGTAGLGSNTYSCGANLLGSDGSNFFPTMATVTVNPLPFPPSEIPSEQ